MGLAAMVERQADDGRHWHLDKRLNIGHLLTTLGLTVAAIAALPVPLDSAQTQTAAAAALTAYDPPTKAEMDTALNALPDPLTSLETQTIVEAALSSYDAPTKAEMDAGFAALPTPLDATQTQSAAAAALTAYDPPTKAELDAALAALPAPLDAAGVRAAQDITDNVATLVVLANNVRVLAGENRSQHSVEIEATIGSQKLTHQHAFYARNLQSKE